MRIAVTYEDGSIFQHFGHTKEFKLYDVEDGKVTPVVTTIADTTVPATVVTNLIHLVFV